MIIDKTKSWIIDGLFHWEGGHQINEYYYTGNPPPYCPYENVKMKEAIGLNPNLWVFHDECVMIHESMIPWEEEIQRDWKE